MKAVVKTEGSPQSLYLKLWLISGREAIGIRGVAVKCEDIRRTTSGEGGLLDSN